eukprot:Skav223907  [mRNA]  locus=scaffold5126:107062:125154:- [translate_table: standard]
MSDQTGQLLGGPPRKDLKDEKIFSDESDSMEKLQKMDKDKVKRMEEREEELREKVEKEKRSVEDYENKKEDLQEEADTETVDQSGHLSQGSSMATPKDSIKPEDEIPVAVATTQEQYRRQKIAKDQDQMQLAKDTQVLAQGQDKLTNLRTPGVAKEELLAEQAVRDQKRIALDQELLMQSQKALAEDMHNAVDGKLRWERLEDYRTLGCTVHGKQRIEQFQDMVNEKLDRLYKEEIDFVKRNRKGKLRQNGAAGAAGGWGAPIDIPRFGPVGVRIVSGPKAALAMGGEDGSYANSQNNFIIPISDLGSCGLAMPLSTADDPIARHEYFGRLFRGESLGKLVQVRPGSPAENLSSSQGVLVMFLPRDRRQQFVCPAVVAARTQESHALHIG